jgi:hypothetical protein
VTAAPGLPPGSTTSSRPTPPMKAPRNVKRCTGSARRSFTAARSTTSTFPDLGEEWSPTPSGTTSCTTSRSRSPGVPYAPGSSVSRPWSRRLQRSRPPSRHRGPLVVGQPDHQEAHREPIGSRGVLPSLQRTPAPAGRLPGRLRDGHLAVERGSCGPSAAPPGLDASLSSKGART